MVCHSLLQWTTFCQTSPPWPARLGWPHTACLSFTELDKAVVRVIRLTSFLWLWFQCVCLLMPSCNTYYLSWVSLTLDVGYLQQSAASAPYFVWGVSPHSRPSWPWTWSSSSRPSWPMQPLLLGHTSLLEKTNQNYSEISPHSYQHGHHQKVYKQ